MKKEYYEELIEEISEMIKTNLYIYYNNSDNYLISIKKYCINNIGSRYTSVTQKLLLTFVQEALIDLTNCPYLYDYRSIE